MRSANRGHRARARAWTPIFLLLLFTLLLSACAGDSGVPPSPSQGGDAVSPSETHSPESPPAAGTDEVPPETDSESPSAHIISEAEALTLLQEKFGTEDAETGHLFSWRPEGMIEIDGREYYNFRWSWLVDDGEGAHLSYLSNVAVRLDGEDIQVIDRPAVSE